MYEYFYIYMIPARGPQTKLKCNPDPQAIEFPYNCSCLVGCHVNLPGGCNTRKITYCVQDSRTQLLFSLSCILPSAKFRSLQLRCSQFGIGWFLNKYVAEKKFMGLATMATSAIVHRCFMGRIHGKSAATGNPDVQATGSRSRQV